MGRDVCHFNHLVISVEKFLNLFKPCHLHAVQQVATSYIPVDFDDLEYEKYVVRIREATSIQESRLAIWEFFLKFVSERETQWVSTEDPWQADLMVDLGFLVVPLRIAFLGNPYKLNYETISDDLDQGYQIAFHCGHLFEEVTTPSGKLIGKIFQQAGVENRDEISSTTWALMF